MPRVHTISTRRWAALALGCLLAADIAPRAARGDDKTPRVAAIVTVYHHNSHADVLVSRLLQTETLDGQGRRPKLRLASLYTDQTPANDTSRKLSKEHGFPIYDTPRAALTLGGDKLAVDGVLLIAEHGKYPESPTGSIQYPKRRLFDEILRVFEASGRVVPVFCDKHLADTWEDAKHIHDEAKRLGVPMFAGSSLPVLWRYPEADTRRGAKLVEMVAVSYHRLDTYGFHALEMVQTLAERRGQGETGVKAARCLEGRAVWEAADRGEFRRDLLAAALARLKERPLPQGKKIEDLAPAPTVFLIEYRDGFKAAVLTLNYAVVEWAVAWQDEAGAVDSTLFWTQEARPYQHFTYLLRGFEEMVHTGRPPYPLERTLLTSGVLDALLQSRAQGGQRLETPHLAIEYGTSWNWKQPPPPPPGRPHNEP